ncbi:MAG: LysR family transcriptional regulator [Deltaproteobacteria bacterium]|nr:LysR family transcriptional regulator [Deltaproteobacteria bacterium]
MVPKLTEIEAFRLTVELGNFTQAAKAAGVTPQAASRAVARLEGHLGVTLLRRNTRHVEVTEAGRRYYDACQAALATLGDAALALRGAEDEPAGEVRISVPTSYGHHRFLPLVGAFHRRYPRITLDVEISNRNVDFIREGFDVAVRGGAFEDASFVARPLGDFTVGVFASPEYLAEHSTPKTPEALHEHACAVFVMPRTGRLLRGASKRGPRR